MRTIQREIVGAFIFSKNGKLLLGKNSKGGVYSGCWVIPGGGIEQGETDLEALAREVSEEVGISIHDASVELIRDDMTGESTKTLQETDEEVFVKMNFKTYKVVLSQPHSTVDVICEEYFESATWFDESEITDLNLSPPTRVVLEYMGIV